MFGVLFGWRKASKCKKVIKRAQCRLNLLKKKRSAIVKHLREDTAYLIKIGHQHIAFDRAEQLIKDESVAVAYELIDNFCDFIRTHFKYIRRNKDCPDDIKEAVSSLIYASARCGDLPELLEIRKLFEERYGQKLAISAVELFPGNLVNRQIKELLGMISVSDDMKHRMVNEIATDYCLQPQCLALEYYPEWQYQVMESSDQQVVVTEDQISTNEISKREAIPIDLSPPQTMTSTSATSPTLQLGSHTALDRKEERIVAAHSSESSQDFTEEALLVYLDDIEELQSPKDEDSQDQRIFKFKGPILSKGVSFYNSVDRRSNAESCESLSEKSSSKSSQRSGRVSRKRAQRRLVYPEDQGLRDAECSSYYAQPQKSIATHKPRFSHQRKQQKKIRAGDNERSHCSGETGVTPLARNRRVYPKRLSYFSTDGDEESNNKLNRCEMLTKSSRRSLCSEKQDQSGSCSTKKVPPYMRNATMPLERSKDRAKEEFQRSNSCPVQENPNHVHPKLPDYDDLTARFMALKKEFLLNKLH